MEGNGNGNGNGRKKRRKRIIVWSSGSVVVLVLVVAGTLIAFSGSTKIDPSKLAKVERGDLAKSVVATGKIEPITKVEIKSKASGIVKSFTSITATELRKVKCSLNSTGRKFRLVSTRPARSWKHRVPA